MFLPSPEHRDGMVEAAILHAHHMFDGLCERAQPHVSPCYFVPCPGFDPCSLALLMRRNSLPCFPLATCVLVSCSGSKDVVRVGRSCHEQWAPCVAHMQLSAAPLLSSRTAPHCCVALSLRRGPCLPRRRTDAVSVTPPSPRCRCTMHPWLSRPGFDFTRS
jgi:hypothetical protein